jgi:hypothetical protein
MFLFIIYSGWTIPKFRYSIKFQTLLTKLAEFEILDLYNDLQMEGITLKVTELWTAYLATHLQDLTNLDADGLVELKKDVLKLNFVKGKRLASLVASLKVDRISLNSNPHIIRLIYLGSGLK